MEPYGATLMLSWQSSPPTGPRVMTILDAREDATVHCHGLKVQEMPVPPLSLFRVLVNFVRALHTRHKTAWEMPDHIKMVYPDFPVLILDLRRYTVSSAWMTAIPSSERLDGLIQCALLIEDVLNWLGAPGWRALLKSQILLVIIRTCVVTPSSPSSFEFFDIIARIIYTLKKYLVHYSILLPTVRSLKALDRGSLWNNDCLNSVDRDEPFGAWYEFRQCVEARKPVLKEYKQTILRTLSKCINQP